MRVHHGEIKMYIDLVMVGFEPTPTTTAAPSNTETTGIPSRHRECDPQGEGGLQIGASLTP